jgi:hypothetical protein
LEEADRLATQRRARVVEAGVELEAAMEKALAGAVLQELLSQL